MWGADFLGGLLHPIFSPPTNNTINKTSQQMESKGNYFYVKKCNLEKNYTKIPNNIFYLKLTASEKLILIYLISNSEDFRVTVYRIRKSLKMHNETVKDALDKLHKLKIVSYINCSTIKVNINEFENHFQTSTLSDSTPNDTTTSTPSELTQVPEVNHTSTPIDTILIPQVNNNNIKEQNQEKKNSPEELTKRSGFDVFGGGVPVPVPLAAPPLGSLAPPTPTHPISYDYNQEAISEFNNPAVIHHTPTDVLQPRVANGKTTNTLVKNIPSFHYSPTEISKQVDGYHLNKSMFFFGDNQNIVSNSYIEFYKEYPTTVATIKAYEQVLYAYLKSALSTFEKLIENSHELNKKLDTESLTITPSSIMEFMERIRNGKHKAYYQKTIYDTARIPANENF